MPPRICSAKTSSGMSTAVLPPLGAARAIITSNIALVASPSARALTTSEWSPSPGRYFERSSRFHRWSCSA
ncbi:MAG: hypothetical protein ABSE49_27175 [Polyangiaceae bacterium]